MLAHPRFTFPLPACLLVSLIAGHLSSLAGGTSTELRTWTSLEDTVLEASYVSSDDKSVTLDRKDGSQPVKIPIGRLTFEDQAFIAGVVALRDTTTRIAAWPVESLPAAYNIEKTDGRHYRSKHFAFIGDLDISAEFIAESCRLFEGTLAAVRALPLDLRAQQPEGWEQFVGTVTERTTFDGIASNTIDTHPSEHILGTYLTEHQQILIPIDAFVDHPDITQVRQTTDNNIHFHSLVHEITQQVTFNLGPLMPVWFNEGLAEYMALIPSTGGRFRFDEAEIGLKNFLENRYRTDKPEIIHPSNMMEHENLGYWSNGLGDHLTATLLVYYLIHLDGDQDGEPMAQAIRTMRATNDRASDLVDEYNAAITEFIPKRDAFNAAVETFQKAAAIYNKRLDDARAGKPVLLESGEDGRVVVGNRPSSKPTPPPPLRVPNILQHQRNNKPLDVSQTGYGFALEAMLRGRSYDQLAEDMKTAYQKIGIAITIREPKATP